MNVKKIFDNIKDIKKYRNNGKDFYYDPYRNILIPATPEEKIRQKTAKFCEDYLKVPNHLIETEMHLHHFENIQDNGRIDIAIFWRDNNSNRALAVVECKAENISLSYQVFCQAKNYADIIGADYMIITNGIEMEQYKYNYDNDKYELLSELVDYDDMLKGEGRINASEDKFIRFDYEKLFNLEVSREYGLNNYFIGEDTPDTLIPHIVNMYECLMDIEHNIGNISNEYFKLCDDLGCIYLNYDDASGGGFGTGRYRAFMIENMDGNSRIINIGIMATGKTHNDPKYGNSTGKSVLVVSISDEKSDEMIVQINLNKFLEVTDNELRLTHNGAVTRKGANKEEFKMLIKEKAPNLIINNEIVLGSFSGKSLIYMDNEDFSDTIKNIITYTLIRDEYKKKFKRK